MKGNMNMDNPQNNLEFKADIMESSFDAVQMLTK